MKPKLEKILLARKFRKEQTKAELLFWEKVKAKRFLGLKFRRQVVLFGFVVDFCCHQYKLVIEIDGEIHEKNKIYDTERDLILSKNGFIIIRFKNIEIENSLEKVMQSIEKLIVDLKK